MSANATLRSPHLRLRPVLGLLLVAQRAMAVSLLVGKVLRIGRMFTKLSVPETLSAPGGQALEARGGSLGEGESPQTGGWNHCAGGFGGE